MREELANEAVQKDVEHMAEEISKLRAEVARLASVPVKWNEDTYRQGYDAAVKERDDTKAARIVALHADLAYAEERRCRVLKFVKKYKREVNLLKAQLEVAMEGLDIYESLIKSGWLGRDTSRDHDHGWALMQLKPIGKLQRAIQTKARIAEMQKGGGA